MTSPKILEWQQGIILGVKDIKRQWPAIPVEIQKLVGGCECPICKGRGLLKLPEGNLTANDGTVICPCPTHFIPCPECMGWGVIDALLPECLKLKARRAA